MAWEIEHYWQAQNINCLVWEKKIIIQKKSTLASWLQACTKVKKKFDITETAIWEEESWFLLNKMKKEREKHGNN